MQLERHNLIGKMVKRYFVALAIFLMIPVTGFGKQKQDPMSNPAMQNLMLTIAMLNKAMNDAAANPMDQWRRQNVAHMMGMMPAAIMGLAKEFKSNKLVDSQLPMVQAMLGGFIDKNVGDKYTAFARNPSKNLIPQVGNNFPQDMLKKGGQPGQANGGTLMFNDDAGKGQQPLSGDLPVTGNAMPKAINDELANLTGAPSEATPAKKDGATLTFDDTAKKADAPATEGNIEVPSPSVPGASAYKSSSGVSDFSTQLVRDLSSVESSLGYTAPRATEEQKLEKKDSDDDKGRIQLSTDKKKRPGQAERLRSGYRRPVDPKFYNTLQLVELALTMYPFALAEQQEESGGGGADFLFGIAAIIAAAAPMVAAAVQADADKKIAKINANAQITMTEMSANTSKYLANQQKDIAVQQATIAADISKQNQDSATKRLDMQLAELRTARQEANAVDEKKRQYQQQLDQERVKLAKEQAQETIRLANVQMRAQLTQAGLSQGFSRSQNSATGLNVASSTLGSRLGAPNTATAAQGSSAAGLSAAGGVGTQLASAGGASTASGSSLAGAAAMGALNSKTRKAATDKLLANAKGVTSDDEDAAEGEWVIDPKTGKKVLMKRKKALARAVPRKPASVRAMTASVANPTTIGNGLRGVMGINKTIAGSTPENLSKGQSELSKMAQTNNNQSFADYLQRQSQEAPQMRRAAAKPAEGPQGHSGAYNAPNLRELDRGLMKSPRGDRNMN